MEILAEILVAAPSFLFVLAIVVFVHEFGHFQMARWCGVKVHTFSMGFGRTLWQRTDRHNTVWRVAMLPLGGYVRFLDDSDAWSSQKGARAAAAEEGSSGATEFKTAEGLTPEEKAAARAAGLFHAQPIWKRAAIVAAGPFSNVIFAALALSLLALVSGRPFALPAVIGEIEAGSPAAVAGLEVGDRVVALNDTPIRNFSELRAALAPRPGEKISLTIDRAGREMSIDAQLAAIEAKDANGKAIKFGQLGVKPQAKRLGPVEAVKEGVGYTANIVALTGKGLGLLLSGKGFDELSGPLGIAKISGQVVTQSLGGDASVTAGARMADLGWNLVMWIAIISIGIGLLNLLPVPVLDGGHLVFYAWEAAVGKPLGMRAQELSYRAGFAVLILLVVIATWNDLQRH